jgi:hypothetical protein
MSDQRRKPSILAVLTALLLAAGLLAGCLSVQNLPPGSAPTGTIATALPLPTVPPVADRAGPRFVQITTSSKTFVKSDCRPTAITVTAVISDPNGVVNVSLWDRVGAEQPYSETQMAVMGTDTYVASVAGLDVPGSAYGTWEFYLTASDRLGNQSQSPVDTSVQFLPCVG